MTGSAVATRSKSVLKQFSEEQIKLIKSQICKPKNRDATDDELILFLYTASQSGLDPLRREVYAVFRYDKNVGDEKMTVQTSIDGYRKVAERTGKYRGQDGPYWCGSDGKWVDVWLKTTPPKAAKVGVYRDGFEKPIYAVALYDEYVQKTKDGYPTRFWKAMPTNQLAKCAEALALRKAIPEGLSSIYTADEMAQANSAPLIEDVQPPKRLSEASEKAEPIATTSQVIEPPQNATSQEEPPPEDREPLVTPDVDKSDDSTLGAWEDLVKIWAIAQGRGIDEFEFWHNITRWETERDGELVVFSKDSFQAASDHIDRRYAADGEAKAAPVWKRKAEEQYSITADNFAEGADDDHKGI